MPEEVQPTWFYTIIITAIITMLGYLAKLVIEWLSSIRTNSRLRKSKLIELLSMLQAAKVAFQEQCRHRNKLDEELSQKYPEIQQSSIGYDDFFSNTYPNMNSRELELHSLIRTITQHTLRPLNTLILQWLQADTYFKSKMNSKGMLSQLAKQLKTLEAHLYLWEAKFLSWIPDNPKHALVFLADEKKHGIGFPKGIEDTVDEILQSDKLFM